MALDGRAGRRTVVEATERRREETARSVEAMPAVRRRELLKALHAFTEAGSEPAASSTAVPAW